MPGTVLGAVCILTCLFPVVFLVSLSFIFEYFEYFKGYLAGLT